MRPADHTAAGATGRGAEKCTGSKLAKPLIVDLDQDARSELEAAMKKGIAVVAYDCASLRVLTACRVADGKYEYAGVSRKEEVIQMTSSDDVAANLPINAAKVSAEVSSGRSIDLALVRVGTKNTTRAVAQGDLTGDCDGATHFVRGATLGAFAMATGSSGKAAAVAEMFAYGASAKSASERKGLNKDGSLDECRKSDPDAESPPTECRAPISVELVPIAAPKVADAASAKGKDAKAKDDDAKEAPSFENPCPEGYAFTGGKCTKAPVAAKLCDPKNEAECKSECDKGSAESCFNFGRLARRDRARAVPAFTKACEGGVADACGELGKLLEPDAQKSKNVKAEALQALTWAEKGCRDGSGYACEIAGDLLTLDAELQIVDYPRGMKRYTRGCNLGNADACSMAANELLSGKNVPRDAARAIAMLGQACLGGSASECDDLGGLFETGKAKGSTEGLKVDPVAAYGFYRRACQLDADSCVSAHKLGQQVGKDADALQHAVRGCGANDEEACLLAGLAYEQGRGAAKDAAKAKELFTKACNKGDGDEDACKKIGVKPKD
jgi:TPR repeat protein